MAGRITSIIVLAAANAVSGRNFTLPEPAVLRLIAPAGVFDVSANALYLLAARQGLLALVAVLSSLYPVGTVLLARVVLKERLTRPQVGGLGMAALGVVCIAAG